MGVSGRTERAAGVAAPRYADAVPERYPFIVVRREWFGGFLFNRFLSYVNLDFVQTRILELCEGYFSVGEITDAVAREFGLAPPVAQRQVGAAFDLFDGCYAIDWRNGRKAGHYVLPEPAPAAGSEEAGVLSAPIYALWDITYACNLNCRHCLTDSGNHPPQPLPFEDVRGIIDQLVDMKVFNIHFVGGEPFMRRDMFDIMSYASQLPIGFSVSTNGVLVDEDLVERLAELNIFDVQVSIDGLEETHDKFRGVPGAFRKAAEAVRRFSDAGIRTTINTVMTRLNRDELDGLVDLALSAGTTTFKAVAFLPVGRGKQNRAHLVLNSEELKECVLRLDELSHRYEGTLTIAAELNYPLPTAGLAEANPAAPNPKMGCAAGTSQIVIDPLGLVFACPFLRDFPAGDLRRQSLREVWENSELFNLFRNIDKAHLTGKCRTCEYAPGQCRGGCRASAYAFTGDLWGDDPLCWSV